MPRDEERTKMRRDLTIPKFCRKHRIGRSTYYDLQARGLGPKLTRIGDRGVRISPEADQEWVEKMQVQAPDKVPKFAPKHQVGDKNDDGVDDSAKEKRHSKNRSGTGKRSHKERY